jgi:hypothetical protein
MTGWIGRGGTAGRVGWVGREPPYMLSERLEAALEGWMSQPQADAQALKQGLACVPLLLRP